MSFFLTTLLKKIEYFFSFDRKKHNTFYLHLFYTIESNKNLLHAFSRTLYIEQWRSFYLNHNIQLINILFKNER